MRQYGIPNSTDISTCSGGYIDFIDPDPADIHIEDIARGLANTSRFGGQTYPYYSVAQHSTLMSYLVSPELATEALLHDASEAYLGDVQQPIKKFLPHYKNIERNMEIVIRNKFGLPVHLSDEVKEMDLRMCVAEKIQVLKCNDLWNSLDSVDPAPVTIIPWMPAESWAKFMERYRTLKLVESGVVK